MEAKPKRKRRIRTIVISAVVILTTSVLFTILNLGHVFAEEILDELVKRQSNDFYSLVFADLDVDLLERKITVRKLFLQPDSSKISKETGLKTIYEIELAELVINIKSLYKFYVQRQLEIESMRIVDPEIRMQRIGERKTTSFSFETGNLYKAISDYLTVLKVDYFRMEDGDLEYNTGQFSVGNIDFMVQNLLLDSAVRNDVFYSETIFLEIQNQKYFLPDSIHEIEFERFVLSTEDSILRFDNLSIHPTKESGIQFEGENSVNVYDIHIPSLALKGIDYQSAYRRDHLIIDKLTFEKPTIFIDDETSRKHKKASDDNSILSLLFSVFHKIDIGEFSINDSELDLKINQDQTYQRIKSGETSVKFTNISLDTTNYRFDQRTKYFDNVEININNYDYILPDNIHEIKFDSLKINSKDSIFSIKNLAISNINPGRDSMSISLIVPSIHLDGFVYNDMIDKKLKVQNLTIDEMVFGLQSKQKEINKPKSKFGISELYEKTAPIFKEIEVNHLQVGPSQFNLQKDISIGRATIELDSLRLSESTKSLKDLFTRSRITLRDIQLNRDSIQLNGDQIVLSHDLTEIDLINWNVLLQTQKIDLVGEVASLKVTELNPDSLVHGNFMTFRKAIIQSPKVNIQRLQSSDSSKSFGLGLEKEVLISNGKFDVTLETLTASIEDITADFYLGDSIAIHSINAQKLFASSPELNHELKINQWVYDTLKDEMTFDSLLISPLNAQDSSQSLINASIPAIKIDGFIQNQFFNHKEFIAERLAFENPDITVHLIKKEQSQKSDSDLALKIQNIDLNSGQFAFSGISPGVNQVIISDFNTEVFGLNFPESKSLFYSDSIQIDISSIVPDLASDDLLSTGHLNFNTKNKTLNLDSILFLKADGSLEFILPELQLVDLDVKELMENGALKASNFTVNSPEFSIINTSKNKNAKKKETELPISITNVDLNDISIFYQDTTKNKEYSVTELNLSLTELDNSGYLDFLSILQNTADFSVAGNSLNMPVNEFYSIETNDYSYHSKNNELSISDVHFKNHYSKTRYTDFLENQKDWFNVTVDEILLQGLDIEEVLTDSILDIESILVDGTELNIYRDKRVPFPEDQIGKLPGEQIMGIPFPINVDTVFFKGTVRYEEHPFDFEETGMISFDDLDAQIINLSNIDIQPNSMMRLIATGQIVEQGNLQVDARFELGRPDQRFTFRGTIEDLPLDSLNQVLGPVARINIKSGYADEIDFQFVADDSVAVGDMLFLYKDLKLQILNAKKHETNLGSGLMSFFANTFVVRSRNPRFIFPRKGTIYFHRDTTRAVFGYWARSILSGTVSSVGIHKSDRQEKQDLRAARKEED